MNSYKYYVFDLDGCLSDHEWRWKAVDHNEPDLDKRYAVYNSHCNIDSAMNLLFVNSLCGDSDTHLLIVTARPERYAAQTIDWCAQHLNNFNSQLLLMRPEGDYRPSPELKVSLINDWTDMLFSGGTTPEFLGMFDDRADVIAAYQKENWPAQLLTKPTAASKEVEDCDGTAAILHQMAETFKERNAVYGSNYKMVGPIMELLWPDGISPSVVTTDQFHLFELIIVKLSRFAISDLTHQDSIHDAAVYCAMIESILRKKDV